MTDMTDTLHTLRSALLTANANMQRAKEALDNRFPHHCTECEGEGLHPDGEGGFDLCSECVVKGRDPLNTQAELLVDEGCDLTPLEAVENCELDALTMPSTGAGLTDWVAHPHRHLDALREEYYEIQDALRQEEREAEAGGARG